MAKKDVDLTLTVKQTGAIKVTVFPYRRHLFKNDKDRASFKFNGDITYAEVSFSGSAWPFKGNNKVLEGSTDFDSPEVDAGASFGDAKYTITLYFDDINGVERSVTIDPDMVID